MAAEPSAPAHPGPSSHPGPLHDDDHSQHRLLTPDTTTTTTAASSSSSRPPSPLIICFHGSGESCSPTWDALATALAAQTRCRVLLYERGADNPTPEVSTQKLRAYLLSGAYLPPLSHDKRQEEAKAKAAGVARTKRGKREGKEGYSDLQCPYILVAHSYGGAFARLFLQQERKNVVGVVLVETGQEGGLDARVDEVQLRRCVLGDRPLVVVRGNSLIGKWRGLEERERMMGAEAEPGKGDKVADGLRQQLQAQRQMLQLCDAEDERLKKRQLGLSRKNKYVHLEGVGHHVIRDRPDTVVEAVQWVLENMDLKETTEGLWAMARRRFKGLGRQ
ncbi:Uu.00g032900.m01.CDS01 [Anthostomella pinea]|uniref:Uu.00g032900.m01.CDS01 n=1 Tax=Anthostomella pinea TaxID=933095 RepID=A0AAI8V992_9PEZI|nr:Uu.00g032900.m01.CDS01 [Anthostomella pinea]